MDSNRKAGVSLSVVITTVGVAWLLNNVGVLPAIEWVWTLGLAVTGVLSFALLGFDKLTIVIGPFLIFCSFFSILRQTGKIALNHEIPILVILLGVLMLFATLSSLKRPAWFLGEE